MATPPDSPPLTPAPAAAVPAGLVSQQTYHVKPGGTTMGRAKKMARILTSAAEQGANFPAVLGWPADAQLGILAVAWATGPSLRYVPEMTDFIAGVNANDFLQMSDAATWADFNPDRKAQVQLLFRSAFWVKRTSGDLKALNWLVNLNTTATTPLGGEAPEPAPPPSMPPPVTQ